VFASEQTINFVWGVSLLLGVVVIVVVALLLHAILSAARRILAGAAEIWTVGQQVANNTVHIALLDRTNHLFGGIAAQAVPLAEATGDIAEATRRTGGGV
jgi:Na+-transporting NADH:ubiquinone oxidoreductase subunit NqrF